MGRKIKIYPERDDSGKPDWEKWERDIEAYENAQADKFDEQRDNEITDFINEDE